MATLVLIHGFFGGGRRWQPVRRGLQAAGHEVYTPTLTGMGERVHLASPAIDLETNVRDLLNVLE
jgi:pimeloyl-ACP methyl ester carboxylesterase